MDVDVSSIGLDALVRGYGLLRRELDRRVGETGREETLWGIDDVLDEALAVLAGEGETLFARAKSAASAVLSRPAIFKYPQPAAWIATRGAQDSVKAAAIALLRGESDAPHAAGAFELYHKFDGDFDDAAASPSAEDAYVTALDYILRSLKRDLSLGDRMVLSTIAGLRDKLDAQATDTSDIVDKHIEFETLRLRRRRFFRTSNTQERARAHAQMLIDGRLRGGSPPVRARALAWCARFLCYSDPGLAGDYLAQARQLGGDTLEEYRVAAAFHASHADWEEALGQLTIGVSPLQTTAALQIIRHGLSPADTIARAEMAGIDGSTIDSDGRFALLALFITAGAWDKALGLISALGDEDFASTPALLWLAATALVAAPLAEDLREVALQDIPQEPATFRLRDDDAALTGRRRARALMLTAADVCSELDLPIEAAAARRYELWLALRDPETMEGARVELRRRAEDRATTVAYIPLALDFGVGMERAFAERAIDAQIARGSGSRHFLASAVLALILDGASHEREETLRRIETHRGLLSEFFDPANLYGLETHLLIELGRHDAAREKLVQADPALLPEPVRSRMLQRLEGGAPELPLEELERLYAEKGATSLLAQIVRIYGARGFSDHYMELARKLISTAGTTEDAKEIIGTLAAHERHAEILELLGLLGEAADRTPELLEHRAWAHFKLGHFNEVGALLTRLEASGDTTNNRALRFQLLVASGRWAELETFIDRQWASRDERTPLELAHCATLAAQAGSRWTRDFILAAVERAPDDPQVLVAAYSAATSAGLEEEIKDAGHWIMRAAALSEGEDGPIQSKSLQDILDMQPEWDERVERANQAYAAGTAPVGSVAGLLRRPWLELQLLPLLANPDRRDPRARSVTPLFGGRRRAETALPAGTLALDRTSVATLAWLGLLDKTIASFGGAIISHGLLGSYFEQLPRIRFHQPSRVTFARQLIELLEHKAVEAFSSTKVPDPVLVQDIGHSLAALLTEAVGETEGQHIVVHPFPITKVGSLRSEVVPLDAYKDHLCSCSAVVDALERTGRLSAGESERARTYLERQEPRWPEEPRIERGATLYLSDLSVSYFRYIGVLAKIEAAGLKVIVSKSELDQARALREWDGQSAKICRVIDDVGATLAKAIEDGRVRVDRDFGEDKEHEGLSEVQSLCQQAAYLLSDDRFLNRYENFEHEGGETRIISTNDIIDHLTAEGRISGAEATEARTALRRGGAIYMPVTRDELVAALGNASVGADAIVETGELRAIRENIRLAQLRGWFDPATDTPWLVHLNAALGDALVEIWSGNANEDAARARSNWLAALAGIRDWANSVVKPGMYHLGGDSIVLDQARFALAYGSVAESGQAAYARWLETEFEQIWESEPRLKPIFLNHMRGVLRSLDPDLLGAAANVPEGARLRIALRGLPPFVQSLLIEADDFREQAELDAGYVVHVGDDAEFARAAFLKAVAAIYADPASDVTIADEAGRAWTVTTNTDGDYWPIRLKSGDVSLQTRGVLALLPTTDARLRALDRLVADSGVSPTVAADWRTALAAGPLDPEAIEIMDKEIAAWPGIVVPTIGAALERQEASIPALVPMNARYYELLAGGDAVSIEAYVAAQKVDPPWQSPLAKARHILLQASHWQLIEGRLDFLTPEQWIELGSWVQADGDLLARIGFIEGALGRAIEQPELEPILLALIAELTALDPEEPGGQLRYFSSIAMFVEGEVSLRGTLSGHRPFARRIATFAHAAILARIAYHGVNRAAFADICIDERGWQFSVQTLVDLRLEPRWRPEYFAPQQVKNEVLGRILNRAGTLTEEKLPAALAKAILGESDSVLAAGSGASVFWPGPIEGALPGHTNDPPAALLDQLAAEFSGERLTIEGISRLLNMETIFGIPDPLLSEIVARLRDAGPKLFAILPEEHVQAYLVGIAYVAASHRFTDLAEHVRMLARYRRNLGMPVSIADEAQLALSAAAAHEPIDDWRVFVGEWITEVAFAVEPLDDARQVESWIETLFDIDPALRATAGRALAAIRLLLDS